MSERKGNTGKIIALDLLNFMEQNHLSEWSTTSFKKKKIPSTLENREFYSNPFEIAVGIRYLSDKGLIKKFSRRRFELEDSIDAIRKTLV